VHQQTVEELKWRLLLAQELQYIQSVSGTTPGTFDEIWLFAQNNHTSDILLTLEFGGTTNPDDNINVTISSKAGLMLIVPGLILQNECVVKAYAASGNYIVITGFCKFYNGLIMTNYLIQYRRTRTPGFIAGIEPPAPPSPYPIENLEFHLDANTLEYENGVAVSEWTELVSDNSPSQSTESMRPTFTTNVINGYPVVRFEGGGED